MVQTKTYACHLCGTVKPGTYFRNCNEEVVTCSKCIVARSLTIIGNHLNLRERYLVAEIHILRDYAASVCYCETIEAYDRVIGMIHGYAEHIPVE